MEKSRLSLEGKLNLTGERPQLPKSTEPAKLEHIRKPKLPANRRKRSTRKGAIGGDDSELELLTLEQIGKKESARKRIEREVRTARRRSIDMTLDSSYNLMDYFEMNNKSDVIRIYKVSGKRRPKVFLCPNVAGIITKEDSIIVEEEKKDIFILDGPKVTRVKRAKARAFAEALKKDHAGKGQIIHIEDTDMDKLEKEIREYEERGEKVPDHLRKKKKHLQRFLDHLSFTMEENDKTKLKMSRLDLYTQTPAQVEANYNKLIRMTKYSSDSEPVEVCYGRKPKYSELDPQCCYILESGNGVFAWVGKQSRIKFRKKFLRIFNKAAEKVEGHPFKISQRNNTNSESAIFKEHFLGWPGETDGIIKSRETRGNIASSRRNRTVKRVSLGTSVVKEMKDAASAEQERVEILPNDGTGTFEVYTVDGKDRYRIVPDQKVVQFFSAESYLLSYKYHPEDGKPYKSIFYYQLKDSSTLMKGSSALQTVAMDSLKLGGDAKQIRIVDRHESMFFWYILDNAMIVHFGINPSLEKLMDKKRERELAVKKKKAMKYKERELSALRQSITISTDDERTETEDMSKSFDSDRFAETRETEPEENESEEERKVGMFDSLKGTDAANEKEQEVVTLDKPHKGSERVYEIRVERGPQCKIPKLIEYHEDPPLKREPVQVRCIQLQKVYQLVRFSVYIYFKEFKSFVEGNDYYVWRGPAVTDGDWELIKTLLLDKSEMFGNAIEVLEDPKEFSNLISSRTLNKITIPEDMGRGPGDVLFWRCSTEKGVTKFSFVKPVQHELRETSCYILDAKEQEGKIFEWVGSKANIEIRKMTSLAISKYKEITSNTQDVKLVRVCSGDEPLEFTRYFHGWHRTPRRKLTKRQRTMIELKNDLMEKKITASYDDIINHRVKGLDPRKLETYMSREEFFKVFGMEPDEFEMLPKWKRDNLKKQKKLF